MDFKRILESADRQTMRDLAAEARAVCDGVYGRGIFIRGLIEFTNHCACDCYYCGLRRSNACVNRFRLTEEEILECCERGYRCGMRTFVLQGGEDAYFTRERLCALIRHIRALYPDCAVTLSVGERSDADYAAFREAGADRYLLRHETADPAHYALLHPKAQRFERRMRCLKTLKELGYQTGCGIMVGSPHQTADMLCKDIRFMEDFKPEMIGIGPFIPQRDTPFAKEEAGSVETTLKLLSIMRILLPNALIPATTALSVLNGGYIRALDAGANVIMLSLTPQRQRGDYDLYDGKADCRDVAELEYERLSAQLRENGYFIDKTRGDARKCP